MAFKVFSTFTGIGGFEIGIANASVGKLNTELVGYSEVDKYAVSVFEYHFKEAKNYGDITKINADELPDFDCLVGGFPCQAFSIAGRRAGFNDTRGTLFFDLARILRAKRPRLFVFENVKGLINHDGGATFRTIIAAIDELGYDSQWQVLNSKDFGVPQNRERIIIVGHLRGTARPQVFPFTGADKKDTRIIGQDVSYAIDANYAKGTNTLAKARRSLVRVGTLRTHNDGKGFRETKSGLAPTIPARARNDGSGQPVILTGSPSYKDGKRQIKYSASDTAPTIRATQHKSGDNQPKVYVPEATKKGYAEATVGDSINLAQPNSKTRRGRVGKGVANTIDTSMHQYTIQPPLISKTVRAGGRNSPHGSKQNWDSYEVDGRIRRLTPLECERLQAFPDNWTAVGSAGPISDSQRYKMCGNAVTTNVIQAVFERIFSSVK